MVWLNLGSHFWRGVHIKPLLKVKPQPMTPVHQYNTNIIQKLQQSLFFLQDQKQAESKGWWVLPTWLKFIWLRKKMRIIQILDARHED